MDGAGYDKEMDRYKNFFKPYCSRRILTELLVKVLANVSIQMMNPTIFPQ